jgi:hypothetical protein
MTKGTKVKLCDLLGRLCVDRVSAFLASIMIERTEEVLFKRISIGMFFVQNHARYSLCSQTSFRWAWLV